MPTVPSTPAGGAVSASAPPERLRRKHGGAAAAASCGWLTCTQMMASAKSGGSTNSGLQDMNSDNNDEENELCPGFKDVDAFVKVSEATEAGRRVILSSG